MPQQPVIPGQRPLVGTCTVCGEPFDQPARGRFLREICRKPSCDAEKQRAYRDEHRDEIAEKQRAYYDEHRDEIAEKKRAYYDEHRDEIAEKKRAYRDEHRDEIAEKQRAYYDEHRDDTPIEARCVHCGDLFDQPRRRGRPFTRCERCRRHKKETRP